MGTSVKLSIAIGLLVLAGCQTDVQSKEAVRQGVIDHLASRSGLDLDLSSMQVDVTAVTFRENEAEATVSFLPKGGAPEAGMAMKYTLEREGSRWKVKKKAETSGSPHSEGMGQTQQGGQLPPGHPPLAQPPLAQPPLAQPPAGGKGK